MTSAHSRKPLAILAGIVILILGHSATHEAADAWTRTLPLLLILILGELVREWLVPHLPLDVDDATRHRRQRLGWIALIGGAVLLVLPIALDVGTGWSARSAWSYLSFAAGILSFSVASALMLVQAKSQMAARRAERERNGEEAAGGPSSPTVFFFSFLAAVVLFAFSNATALEALASHRALSGGQVIRAVVSALLCTGLVILVMVRFSATDGRPSDAADPEAGTT